MAQRYSVTRVASRPRLGFKVTRPRFEVMSPILGFKVMNLEAEIRAMAHRYGVTRVASRPMRIVGI